jgi:cytochrome c-type biogenesis protein
MDFVSILTAMVAGFISFVSPCVLPLVPAYVSYISGVSIDNLKESNKNSQKVLINSIAFAIGFSIVFIALGASASIVGKVLARNKKTFDLIAGLIIIIFGIHTTGLIRLQFLNYEKKAKTSKRSPSFLNALILGFAFSFGWTPCVGPILGAILAKASTYDTMAKGIFLLSFYSLGMAIPFILAAIALDKFFTVFKSIRKYFKQIEIFAGLLLIGLGLSLVFGMGLHSLYIFGIISLSIGIAFLSLRDISLIELLGLILLLISLPLVAGFDFNIRLLSIFILALVGFLVIKKTGRELQT